MERFKIKTSLVVRMLVCLLILIMFWNVPAVAPISPIGMKVIGAFITTVLMLSLVDPIWPALLALVLLSRTGIMSLNDAIAGSMGNWITYFVIMSFIMTEALNRSGFTSRLVSYYMSRKFVSKSPWHFTYSLCILAAIVGCFMDQVPVTAFFLSFCARIFKELGYEPGDSYPKLLTMAVVFSVNIGGAATPISHSLAILGIGIYEGATGQVLNLFTYLAFGIPVAIVLMLLMAVILKLSLKPDMSKFETFDINKVLEEQKPMDLREKSVVAIFFGTVILWMLPGVLQMFIGSQAQLIKLLNSFGITFWAILSVVLMSVISIDEEPLIDLKDILTHGFAWNIIIFLSVGVLLGGAVSKPEVGLTSFITENITPLIQNISPLLIVLLIALVTTLMTNFAANVPTITVMTGVGCAVAMAAGSGLNPMAISLVTTFAGSSAYMMPSSFAPIAMLHGDEYSESSMIIKYGFIAVLVTALVAAFVGYPLIANLF